MKDTKQTIFEEYLERIITSSIGHDLCTMCQHQYDDFTDFCGPDADEDGFTGCFRLKKAYRQNVIEQIAAEKRHKDEDKKD
jgi:hypothetical protein